MNIRVDLNTPITDGTEVVFRSPVDCSQVTGLIVYYNDGSKEFAFADAHGNNVGDIDHLFAENVVVKVILDVTTGMAFVQNADTNAYLEGRFQSIDESLEELEQKADAIVCTAQGEEIYVTDSSNDPIRGLKIFGKTTQDGTPSVDNPVALMSVGDSGNFTVYVTQGEDGVESMPVATPNGLLGIPVSSGGNYTDASGQQWICDEIDLGRGVYVQRVRRFELAVADMNNLEEYPGWKNVEGLKECVEHLAGIPNINWPRLINIGGYVNVNTSGTNELLFLTPVSNGGISQSEWKATYPDLIVDVMLPLEEEVETLLSAEEIAQFKTLHTNYPTTDISNSEDAYMALEYNADTKTYVDNGIASVPTGGGGGNTQTNTKLITVADITFENDTVVGGENDDISFGDAAVGGRHFFYKTPEGEQLKATRVWGYFNPGADMTMSGFIISPYYKDGKPNAWHFGDLNGNNVGVTSFAQSGTMTNKQYLVFALSADLKISQCFAVTNVNWTTTNPNMAISYKSIDTIIPHFSGFKISSTGTHTIPAGSKLVLRAEVVDNA